MATTTLKGTIIEQIIYVDTSTIGTTASAHICNWQNYDLLIIQISLYANPLTTCTVPVNYFVLTNSGNRPILYDPTYNFTVELYQNGEGSIYAKSSVSDTKLRLKIYGLKFK